MNPDITIEDGTESFFEYSAHIQTAVIKSSLKDSVRYVRLYAVGAENTFTVVHDGGRSLPAWLYELCQTHGLEIITHDGEHGRTDVSDEPMW